MRKRGLPLPARLALRLLCGAAVGFGLLLAAYALPTAPIARNVRASVPALSGAWGKGEDSYHQLVKGYLGTQLDNSTDAAMLLAAAHESDDPLWRRAVDARTYRKAPNAYASLLSYGENGAEGLESPGIARYWHGYLAVLKPLLMVMSYLDIRVLLMTAQGALMAAVAAGLCRRGLARAVPAFALAMLGLTPAATGLSLQFSTAMLTALAAMLRLLYGRAEGWRGQAPALFFLTVGMATSYFDYLTYPIVTFALPFALTPLLYPKEGFRAELARLAGLGLCWALGYFGLWAIKWLLAATLGSEPYFLQNLLAKIAERGGDAAEGGRVTYLAVVWAQLKVFAKKGYIPLALAAAAGCAWAWARALRGGEAPTRAWPRRAVLALVALLPFIWFFFTKNHSYNHAFFTSRALAATVFAAGLALTPEGAGKGARVSG